MKKSSIALTLIFCILLLCTGCAKSDYKKATDLFNSKEYLETKELFTKLGDYEDSATMAMKCLYEEAQLAIKDQDYDYAIELLSSTNGYSDSEKLISNCKRQLLRNYIFECGDEEDGTYWIDRQIGDGKSIRIGAIKSEKNKVIFSSQSNLGMSQSGGGGTIWIEKSVVFIDGNVSNINVIDGWTVVNAYGKTSFIESNEYRGTINISAYKYGDRIDIKSGQNTSQVAGYSPDSYSKTPDADDLKKN